MKIIIFWLGWKWKSHKFYVGWRQNSSDTTAAAAAAEQQMQTECNAH